NWCCPENRRARHRRAATRRRRSVAGLGILAVALIAFAIANGSSSSTSSPSSAAVLRLAAHHAPDVYVADETTQINPKVAGIPERVYVPNSSQHRRCN